MNEWGATDGVVGTDVECSDDLRPGGFLVNIKTIGNSVLCRGRLGLFVAEASNAD